MLFCNIESVDGAIFSSSVIDLWGRISAPSSRAPNCGILHRGCLDAHPLTSFLAALAANDYYVTGRPILQLASVGGFVDVARLHNQIPEVKIWEDGTTIFTIDDQGVRKVQYAHMRPTDVKNLVDKIVASGFLQFQVFIILHNNMMF